jgi:hypothetical protein
VRAGIDGECGNRNVGVLLHAKVGRDHGQEPQLRLHQGQEPVERQPLVSECFEVFLRCDGRAALLLENV